MTIYEALPFLKCFRKFSRCLGGLSNEQESEYSRSLSLFGDSHVNLNKKQDSGKDDSFETDGEEKNDDAVELDQLEVMAKATGSDFKDPFLQFGIGALNYFKLQEKLLMIFFVLSIGACIQMKIFSSFGGLEYLEDYVLPLTTISFGNMGFAGTSCAKMPIDWAHETSVTLHVHC